MKHTSIRELHIRTSELVREASEGSVIVIERRGEPVAELRPIQKSKGISAAKKAQIFASMQPIWKRLPKTGDSGRIIEEDRNR
jgi:prevent-host-death family protein